MKVSLVALDKYKLEFNDKNEYEFNTYEYDFKYDEFLLMALPTRTGIWCR